MILLSVDPGLRGCGLSLWEGAELIRAAYVENSEREDSGPLAARSMALAVSAWCAGTLPLQAVDALILEFPTVYGGRASRGDARDLFPLAAVDGAIAMAFPEASVSHVEPHDWKGSVKKPKRASDTYAIAARVVERLGADERARVEWPKSAKLRMDVADAVGVGLHRLGRFERLRVIHRRSDVT